MLATYLDVYRAQFKATIATQLQYRVALIIWLIYTLLEPTIFLVVWSAVARATGGRVGGYGPEEFAAYYIVSMWVGHLTFTWIMHEMEFRIRLGQFSPKLLRPIHPIHADIADNISYKFLTLVVLIPATVAMALLFQPRANPPAWAPLALVPALLLAFVSRFAIGWTLALAAFWTTRVNAINQLYFSVFMFLSGTMFPLSLLPGWLVTVSWLLPFRWMVAFPVELALGRLTPSEALVGLGMQALWTVVILLLLDRVWWRAVRQYTAVGA
jgi:ABC-2 type transport system permease protein